MHSENEIPKDCVPHNINDYSIDGNSYKTAGVDSRKTIKKNNLHLLPKLMGTDGKKITREKFD